MISPKNPEEQAVIDLYHGILHRWNIRDAPGMASLFTEDGHVVGFDGSQMDGREQIAAEVERIFAEHQTAKFVGKVRDIQLLVPQVALLRAVVGMVPPGQKDINPAVNAVQSLVAVKRNKEWRAILYQNTPAQFHGRPDLVEALTVELRELLSIIREG